VCSADLASLSCKSIFRTCPALSVCSGPVRCSFKHKTWAAPAPDHHDSQGQTYTLPGSRYTCLLCVHFGLGSCLVQWGVCIWPASAMFGNGREGWSYVVVSMSVARVLCCPLSAPSKSTPMCLQWSGASCHSDRWVPCQLHLAASCKRVAA
jgi:hypothetical protein